MQRASIKGLGRLLRPVQAVRPKYGMSQTTSIAGALNKRMSYSPKEPEIYERKYQELKQQAAEYASSMTAKMTNPYTAATPPTYNPFRESWEQQYQPKAPDPYAKAVAKVKPRITRIKQFIQIASKWQPMDGGTLDFEEWQKKNPKILVVSTSFLTQQNTTVLIVTYSEEI